MMANKNPFSEANSKGLCRICSKEFSGKELRKHIIACLKNNKGKEEAFLLKAVSIIYLKQFFYPPAF